MYIKRVRKSNRNSKKCYEYLHLVENVRTENGPRQRLIMNLGSMNIAPEKYKELANCIDGMLTGQQELFSTDPNIEKLARKTADKIRDKSGAERDNSMTACPPATAEFLYQNVDVASIQASQIRSLGAEYVCHCIWNELKINDLLLSPGRPPKIPHLWPLENPPPTG